jgi:uncharacterized protein (TIGR00730 family)
MIQPARVTVFCGSSPGKDTVHAGAARALGKALVARGLGLVTGGGRVGLMGVVADAVLVAGGEAIGVIPKTLEARELAHRTMTELHVVGSMHERKALMAALGGAFVALPGGMGTLEELFEVLTWAQLGLHQKPVGLLDVAGYYAPLIGFLDHAVTAGFLHPAHRKLLLVETDAAKLVDALLAAPPPAAPAVPVVKP